MGPVRKPTTTIELRDGLTVVLRPIDDGDRQALHAYLDGLGPMARQRRFLQALPHVPDRLLNMLTAPAATTLVLVAMHGEEIIGEAILGPDAHDPAVAHIGYSVAERVRRRGLGRAMVGRLLEVAGDRGVSTVRADMAADNHPSAALLSGLGAAMRFEDGLIVAELECCPRHLVAA